MFSRLLGLFILALGLILFHYNFQAPLEVAQSHDPQLTYDMKGVIIGPVFSLMGLAFIIFGNKLADLFMNQKQTWKPMAALVILITFSMLPVIWFENRMEALGYKKVTKEELIEKRLEDQRRDSENYLNGRRPIYSHSQTNP